MELTADTGPVIGEIAHIIAESLEGPRGKSDMSSEERNDYSNLILLCPTHHATIDGDPETWTPEKVSLAKIEHEKWVSSQLDLGNIRVASLENAEFIDQRKKAWGILTAGRVWLISSLTPLTITDDLINPLEPSIVGVINSIQLESGKSLNRYHTRPNDLGIINDDMRHIEAGLAHRIQLARNGSCEILESLEHCISPFENKGGDIIPKIRTINYLIFAATLKKHILAVKTLWDAALPFNDALLTVVLTNITGTKLYARPGAAVYDDRFGHTVETPNLEYSSVVNKKESVNDLTETFSIRFVNYFGLVLDKLYDDAGHFAWPRFLVC